MRHLIIVLLLFRFTPEAFGLSPVSSYHFSSRCLNVDIEGDYAYLATAWGLEIYDLTGEDRPRKIGETPTPGTAEDVDVKGDLAYVADYEGMVIIDKSNAADPRVVKTTPIEGKARRIKVTDKIACVVGKDLTILDISDPLNPKLLSTVKGLSCRDMALTEDRIYMTGPGKEFKVVDISDPKAPRIGRRLNTPDYAEGVAIAGDIALITAGTGVTAFSIRNPDDPRFLSRLDLYERAVAITVEGRYVIIGVGRQILTVDIGDPQKMKMVSAAELVWQRGLTVSSRALGISVGRGWIVVADGKSTPTTARLNDKGEILNLNVAPGLSNRNAGVMASGKYVFVVYEEGVMVFDRSNLAPISSVWGDIIGHEVLKFGDFLIVAGDWVYVFDISDPEKPKIKWFESTGWSEGGIWIEGDKLFVADNISELDIFDLNPLHRGRRMELLSSLPIDGIVDVVVQSGYAFVASRRSGIMVVDVRFPAKPSIIFTMRSVKAHRLAISDGYLFASTPESVTILSIGDPRRPKVVSALPLREISVNDIEVNDRALFIAGYNGLTVVDVSHPSNPRIATVFDTPMAAQDVFVEGDMIYLVDSGDLFAFNMPSWQIIDVSSGGFKPSRYGELKLKGSRIKDRTPTRTVLLQNYPNPFNGETWIPFLLSRGSEVTVNIYNSLGRLVRRIDVGYLEAGEYLGRGEAILWDSRDNAGERVSSGIYFYELRADETKEIKKLMLLK
jgi:hypothetical protein